MATIRDEDVERERLWQAEDERRREERKKEKAEKEAEKLASARRAIEREEREIRKAITNERLNQKIRFFEEEIDHDKRRAALTKKWSDYNLSQANEKRYFHKLLHELCVDVDELPRKVIPGRRRLPTSEMLFAAICKVYERMPARRMNGDLEIAFTSGYLSHVPHFNTVLNYLAMDEIRPYLMEIIHKSASPLASLEDDFACDSTGFSPNQFSRWMNARGHHFDKSQTWVKLHIACGIKTKIVTGVVVTDRRGGDAPQLKSLIQQTSKNFKLRNVMADKAYLSEKNLRFISEKGATPFIPFKATNVKDGHGPTWTAMYHLFHYKKESFLEVYRQRALVESTFSMIKRRFSDTLRSKSEAAKVNEVLCKVICHNICCVIRVMHDLQVLVKYKDEEGLLEIAE